ncbi:DUF6279 family lipoprotein [Vibrio rarus]|uniref:DUF6279 family lipoprotein n=1 Tax=Vibrio rarus TaxID=413403 RepID=UPI0021C45149|nr:DUF6279 family lipoprotein [Vibrio rarus]
MGRVILPQWALVIGLVITLSGCTAKLLYRNIDWVILEYVEDYVTLNSQQEQNLELQLQQLTQWHRTEELPRYQRQLQGLYDANLSTIDIPFIEQQQQLFQDHIKRLAHRVTPNLYLLSQSLTQAQIDEFIDNLTEQHQRYSEKFSKRTPQQARVQYFERIEKILRRWLGPLSVEQQEIAMHWANNIESSHQQWAMYRLSTRDRVQAMFAARGDARFFQKELTSLINQPQQGYSITLTQRLERNRALAHQSIVQLLSTASDKQKQHFRQQVGEWLELTETLQQKPK